MTNYTQNDITTLFKKADSYKTLIDEKRPLDEVEIKQLSDYFKIGLTYSSNALEGNTLTISETKVLLEDGLTVGGKPIKDCYEAVGHGAAFDFMMEYAKKSPLNISEESILKLHRLFYLRVNEASAGAYRNKQVFISGTEYLPPKAEDVQAAMTKFIKTINCDLHPIELAALVHKQLVDIHPFEDGNGRTARLLMNLILVNKGYGVAIIPPIMRNDYIEALRASQRDYNPTNLPFIGLISQCVLETQRDYCRLLRIPLQV